MKHTIIITLFFITTFAEAQSLIIQDQATQKFGIINPYTNEPVWPAEFDQAYVVFKHDSLARVTKNGRKGVVSMTGRMVVPVVYDEIHDVQAGEEHSLLAVSNGGNQGLWSIKTGKLVLPMEFEYTRAIYPDLFAARYKNSETLEFFNENGKKQFETAGVSAWPGFDNTNMVIFDTAKNARFLDKKGQPVFSEKFKDGCWTDGEFVVVVRKTTNGEVGKYALLNIKGDTILPVSDCSFLLVSPGKFIVTNELDKQKGLFDARGRKWLIPVGKWNLFKYGEKNDPNGLIYVLNSGYSGGHYLCDTSGKVLIKNCYVSNFQFDSKKKAQLGADYKPYNYCYVYALSDYKQQALYAYDGRPILPDMVYEKFMYYSERHAIIAWRKHPTLAESYDVNAYNPKTGKALFPEPYQDLYFTEDPTRYWARKGGRWGIVETSHSASASFEFDRVEPNFNGTLVAQKGGKCYLYNNKGQRVIERGFDWILPPHVYQYQTFKSNKAARGKLLALGGDKTRDGGCFALNDRKEAIFMEHLYDDPSQNDDYGIVQDEQAPSPVAETIEVASPSPAVVSELSKSDYIYYACDRRAEFPGGEEAQLKFLSKNLQYPSEARKNNIQGRVVVKFVVEKDGSLSNASIEVPLDKDCDAEALRLLQLMPKWKPGRMDDSGIVRVWYSMAVNFKLN